MNSTIDDLKNILCIKKSDFFISLGAGDHSRQIIDLMRKAVDVSTGVAMSRKELDDCAGMRTKIYENVKSINANDIFDKVYCNYLDIPQHLRNLEEIIASCVKLCVPQGLVFVAGMEDKAALLTVLKKHGINKYWYFNTTNYTGCFDILFKKEILKNGR